MHCCLTSCVNLIKTCIFKKQDARPFYSLSDRSLPRLTVLCCLLLMMQLSLSVFCHAAFYLPRVEHWTMEAGLILLLLLAAPMLCLSLTRSQEKQQNKKDTNREKKRLALGYYYIADALPLVPFSPPLFSWSALSIPSYCCCLSPISILGILVPPSMNGETNK